MHNGRSAAALAALLACIATPCLAQTGGNVNPGSPATPGLLTGSNNGGSSGGTTNPHTTAPNGRATMLSPASHSYSIRNYAGQAITDATATMTDGSTQKLNPSGPIAAAGASQIIVPLNQCLAGVTVKLRDGHSFQTGQLNDCGVTQIMVNRNGIQLGSTQTPGSKTGSPTK